jgi:dTDP-4-dehydrorhamnose 3,5-epimerase
VRIEPTILPGVVLIHPSVYGDARGWFLESWNQRNYAELGIDRPFVQDNVSHSARGILRGLHFQNPNPQGKLVQVLQGEVYDVAVDIRRGSPQFGEWFGARLSAENHTQMYIPEGFAHGFCVLSDTAVFSYKCTDFYNPQAEFSVAWDDPDLGITWPIREPLLSAKDRAAQPLKALDSSQLPAVSA